MLQKLLRLNKRINRVVDGKSYHKFSITIPKKGILDVLRWDERTELTIELKGKEIRIRKKKKK